MTFLFAALFTAAAVFACAMCHRAGRNEGFGQGMAAGRDLERARATGRTQL